MEKRKKNVLNINKTLCYIKTSKNDIVHKNVKVIMQFNIHLLWVNRKIMVLKKVHSIITKILTQRARR